MNGSSDSANQFFEDALPPQAGTPRRDEKVDLVAVHEQLRTGYAELARKWGRRGARSFGIAFWCAVCMVFDLERFLPIPDAGFIVGFMASCFGADALWSWEHWRFDKAVARS